VVEKTKQESQAIGKRATTCIVPVAVLTFKIIQGQ